MMIVRASIRVDFRHIRYVVRILFSQAFMRKSQRMCTNVGVFRLIRNSINDNYTFSFEIVARVRVKAHKHQHHNPFELVMILIAFSLLMFRFSVPMILSQILFVVFYMYAFHVLIR